MMYLLFSDKAYAKNKILRNFYICSLFICLCYFKGKIRDLLFVLFLHRIFLPKRTLKNLIEA